MDAAKPSCCDLKTDAHVRDRSKKYNGIASFFSTLLLILLPKCPFCIAAYSGAILLFFNIDNAQAVPYFTHIKPVLGLIILCLILFRYKGTKTKIAIGVASVSLLLLLGKIYFNMTLLPEWLSYIGFLFAIWYNGNFEYFYRFIKVNK